MKKNFLDILSDENGNTYFVENGVVKSNAQINPLSNSPDGWRDHQIKVARNTTYFGLFRTFSLPLKFVKQAAQIIRNRIYKFGVEDIIYYYKLKLNSTTGKHSLMYKGELDLTTNKDILTSCQVVTVDGGVNKFLKANENVTYEIDLTGDGVVDVELETCKLEQNAFFLKPGEQSSGTQNLNLTLISLNEKNSFNSKSQEFIQINSFSDLYNTDFYFNKTTSESTFTFDYNLEMYTLGIYELRLYGFDDSNTKVVDELLQVGQVVSISVIFILLKISGTTIITTPIPKGTRLYLCLMRNNGGVTEFDSMFPMTFLDNPELDDKKYFINVKYGFQKTNTICKAISAIELGNRLVKKMCGDNSYTLISSELFNSYIYITSGDSIRGFSDAKIKTSFKDFFTSFNRNLCLGLSTQDKSILIERREIFYDKSTMLYDLGEIKNAEIKPASDLFFKKIKIGYPDQNYEDLNGRKEFNNTLEFTSPLSKATKDLDLTAPYRADMYGITFAQINLEGKSTTDSSSDNSVFMLDVDTSLYPEDIIFDSATKSFGVLEVDLPINKLSLTNAMELTLNKSEITYKGPTKKISLITTFKFENTNYELYLYLNGIPILTSYNNNIDGILNTTTSFQVNDGDVLKFRAKSLNTQNLYLISFQATFTLSISSKKKLFRYPNQENVVSGVPFPEKAFNVRLSPKRCLLRHGAWIRGILQPYDNKYLIYQTTTKNTITTNYNGQVLDEKSNVLIGTLDANYFLPFYQQFETVVPETLFQLILNNGLNGYMATMYRNTTLKGFVIDAAQKPGDDESQTFTLLLTSDNNLNKLSNG
jgi:hypothetical protein